MLLWCRLLAIWDMTAPDSGLSTQIFVLSFILSSHLCRLYSKYTGDQDKCSSWSQKSLASREEDNLRTGVCCDPESFETSGKAFLSCLSLRLPCAEAMTGTWSKQNTVLLWHLGSQLGRRSSTFHPPYTPHHFCFSKFIDNKENSKHYKIVLVWCL